MAYNSTFWCHICRKEDVYVAVNHWVDTECPICLENKPCHSVFICGHSMCVDCIEEYAKERLPVIETEGNWRTDTTLTPHPPFVCEGRMLLWVKYAFGHDDWTLIDYVNGSSWNSPGDPPPPPPLSVPDAIPQWSDSDRRWYVE